VGYQANSAPHITWIRQNRSRTSKSDAGNAHKDVIRLR
jgi:hypothetical protein